MSFDTLFAGPMGRTPRGPFMAGLIVLLAAAAFFAFVVTGRTAEFCIVVLIAPFIMLHARRLHDMGQTAWLLAVPGALMVAAAWLRLYQADSPLTAPGLAVALVAAAGFAVWGAVGKGQAGANRFGAPVVA